jgi:hypothetical protein
MGYLDHQALREPLMRQVVDFVVEGLLYVENFQALVLPIVDEQV